MPQPPAMVDSLDTLAKSYAVVLCDVWGVLHNGVSAFSPAVEALARARRAGKAVVLVTNSPRPSDLVKEQLRQIGVPDEAWDEVVTSGDVTRELIRNGPRRVFHLGPDRDLPIYDGLDAELVEEFEASGVVCTGLFDDEAETPEDYAEMLQRLRARDLPFICANPDIVVERGDRLVFCAGALARDYGLLGGRTLIAGKPHRPIYEAALAAAGRELGREVGPGDALAVGDGVLTDVKGAAGMGIDVLFVTEGIHISEYKEDGRLDEARLAAFLEKHGHKPVAAVERLR
ncbi:TIGR01459 family HAD-type hydrolase [Chelativorans sp. AA-79]|uniref:TIGR01459 family HAD-type hydrolase n=1 Tax=Chelativorans sp. AA-79 TaxID=3028735 RepID=UPI0023F9885A|nr:TIGR01459 family HAD-type hydrolase [Chelativorans sp. AA-79]WEX08435.1 TIGR01459 family HAD-type hydrolase [Chelativorans sp. AA-79]